MAYESFVLTSTLPFTLTYLLLALIPLYLELYCIGSRAPAPLHFSHYSYCCDRFRYLSVCSIDTMSPNRRHPASSMRNCNYEGTRHVFPPTSTPQFSNFPQIMLKYAYYLLTELRYESFDISTVRSRNLNLSSTREYGIHLAIFLILQLLPKIPWSKRSEYYSQFG